MVADVLMTPFAPSHFDFVRRYAGPADTQRISPVPGDLAAFDAVLTNQRVFGGLKDFGPPQDIRFTRLLPLGRLREWLVGYIGTAGQIGVLGFLNLGFPPPDPNGYSASPLGGWRRVFDQFTVFSFQPQILAEVTPQLHFEQAKRPAQLRLRIDDPTNARIMPLANNWAYYRTRETSLNNLRLLSDLDQQLHVPPASCREAAEFLLDAKLVDPLGGNYVYRENGNGFWPLDLHRPGKPAPRRRTAYHRGPARLFGPALELVPRPGPGSRHDGEKSVRPRRNHHEDAGKKVVHLPSAERTHVWFI